MNDLPVQGRFAGLYRRLTNGLAGGAGPLERLSFLFVFVGAKVIALVGILWLASAASAETFGGVELALAVALIVSGIGLLGVPGGVTRLALTMGEDRIGDLLTFAALTVAAPATVFALAALALGVQPVVVLILASCAVAAFQMFGTTFARIRARPMLNSIVDPLPVLSTLVIAAGLWLTGRLSLGSMSLAMTGLAVVLTGFLMAGFLRTRRPTFLPVYRRVLTISLPILAFSGVAMMVGAGLRPLLGVRFSLEDLAIYSLCFRLCAPSMLMHQMVATAFFARVYTAADRSFDLIVAGLAGACMVTAFLVWLALPFLVPLAFPAYTSAVGDLTFIFPLVGLQVIYWILIALLEMKVGRHTVAGTAAVAGYAIFALFALIFMVSPTDTLIWTTALFDGALAVFATAQLVLLRRRDVRLPLIQCAIPLAGLACGALVLVSG